MDERTFMSQFRFNPEYAGASGVECEYFLTDDSGMPVARSPKFLTAIGDNAWTYELSACQVEHRTAPERDIDRILAAITESRRKAQQVAETLEVNFEILEVASARMPLLVYPHDERYRAIAKNLPTETLAAACRVAGTHVHVGVAGIDEALAIHNRVVSELESFIEMGDHSDGERIRLYRTMAEHWQPPLYESVEHLHAVAREQEFETNVRNCWHLVRISRHGTVELRMFGVTEHVEEIGDWLNAIRQTINTR